MKRIRWTRETESLVFFWVLMFVLWWAVIYNLYTV